MKKPYILISLILLILPGINQLHAQTFYLSPSGNNANAGTPEQPLSSLNAAVSKARELRIKGELDKPVEIIALGGEYFMMQPLELNSDDSGTEGSPLIIRSEPGKKAVFRGGINVTGFEKVNETLWRAYIPNVALYDYYFEQLYVNGKRATRARTPDKGFFQVKGVSETIIDKGEGRSPEAAVQKIFLDSADASCFNTFRQQDYADALVTFYHNWDNTRKHIFHFSSKESAIFTAGEGMKPWNPINNKSRWFADNFMGALDTPGEWFLERSGYLYYIPEKGQTTANTIFTIPVIKEFVVIKGTREKPVRNVRFENLDLEVAAYHTPSQGNEPAQAAAPVSAVITLDNAENIIFTGCEISHTGTYAFWFRRNVENCTVQRCYMHDLGAGGVKIGETIIREDSAEVTSHITVDNNIIRDAGHVFPCAVGIIIFNASDNRITHNEIADLRYSGISAGWVWGYAYSPSKRNKIEFNHIHHLGWGELCDMGGVYTLGASEGTTVSNNVIHHVYSFDYGGWGLYTDEGSYGIVEENNLVYRCKNSGFHQHYGKGNIIRNNIFALNIRAQLQATRIEEHKSITFTNNIVYFDQGTLLSSNWHKFNLSSDYNCYYNPVSGISFAGQSFDEWKKSGKDVHSVIADPLFIDPASSDFHLKKLTVAKKIGFKPFDYSQAGVYGDEEWKKLAAFDPRLAAEFDSTVERLESIYLRPAFLPDKVFPFTVIAY
ncbi:MAG TPA: right-handed parallel beta-helix repeat-containing protein [Bacteroidales bacterium]|jgi:hypothetical protein|nr:right-handed parallel beta-helix repeat-containing protein [Bacteroidales bacterium]